MSVMARLPAAFAVLPAFRRQDFIFFETFIAGIETGTERAPDPEPAA
jgi:hypothetical protein